MTYQYPGNELLLFKHAVKWKAYLAKKIRPFVKGSVLEVGAGIGANTQFLNDGSATNWTMLEPDKEMFEYISKQKPVYYSNTEVFFGTIKEIKQNKFDVVIYIDVLEHIAEDVEEVIVASKLLNQGGFLIILSPAFNFLYSDFDKKIGHFRRYTKQGLIDIVPDFLHLVSIQYMDSMGFFASAMNKLILHQSEPTEKQVIFWDRFIVPISTTADFIFSNSFGKSILGIWQKT